jgi:hypothetical protein
LVSRKAFTSLGDKEKKATSAMAAIPENHAKTSNSTSMGHS